MHTHKPGRFFLVAFVAILALVMADQLTKWLVIETMLRQAPEAPDFWQWFTTRKLIPAGMEEPEAYNAVTLAPWLNFVMVWNRGVSFGMFDGENTLPQVVFIGFSLCVVMALVIWLALARGKLLSLALPLIIGGAIANVIDRVRFGAVADFIDVHAGGRHWPAFNLADSCIVAGAVLLALDALAASRKKAQA